MYAALASAGEELPNSFKGSSAASKKTGQSTNEQNRRAPERRPGVSLTLRQSSAEAGEQRGGGTRPPWERRGWVGPGQRPLWVKGNGSTRSGGLLGYEDTTHVHGLRDLRGPCESGKGKRREAEGTCEDT